MKMENKKDKVKLNDDRLDKVSGGKSSCYGTVEEITGTVLMK